MPKIRPAALAFVLVTVILLSIAQLGIVSAELVKVNVEKVVDGDTVRISPALEVAEGLRDRVRFADINAPEIDTPEGKVSKEALDSLLARYNYTIYLDIDKKSGIDRYGRIVAVVYVKYNETHLMNVNLWLVENGYAEIIDYPNSFDPKEWRLFVEIPASSSKNDIDIRELLISAIILAALYLVITLMRKSAKRR